MQRNQPSIYKRLIMTCPECKGDLFKDKLSDNSQQREGCWTCKLCKMSWFIIPLKRRSKWKNN